MISIIFDEESKKKFKEEVEKLNFKRLSIVDSDSPIVTFIHHAKEIDSKWKSVDIPVRIDGYGRNDKYEAFVGVFYPTGVEELDRFLIDETFIMEMVRPIFVISKDVRNSKWSRPSDLRFWSLAEPFFINGKLEEKTFKDKEVKNG